MCDNFKSQPTWPGQVLAQPGDLAKDRAQARTKARPSTQHSAIKCAYLLPVIEHLWLLWPNGFARPRSGPLLHNCYGFGFKTDRLAEGIGMGFGIGIEADSYVGPRALKSIDYKVYA